MGMKQPTIEEMATFTFQLRNKAQRGGQIRMIAKFYGQKVANEVKQAVIEKFKQGREESDFANIRESLWNIKNRK